MPSILETSFRLTVGRQSAAHDRIQEIVFADGVCHAEWRPVRPMPADDDVFEVVWRDYRENRFVH